MKTFYTHTHRRIEVSCKWKYSVVLSREYFSRIHWIVRVSYERNWRRHILRDGFHEGTRDRAGINELVALFPRQRTTTQLSLFTQRCVRRLALLFHHYIPFFFARPATFYIYIYIYRCCYWLRKFIEKDKGRLLKHRH